MAESATSIADSNREQSYGAGFAILCAIVMILGMHVNIQRDRLRLSDARLSMSHEKRQA